MALVRARISPWKCTSSVFTLAAHHPMTARGIIEDGTRKHEFPCGRKGKKSSGFSPSPTKYVCECYMPRSFLTAYPGSLFTIQDAACTPCADHPPDPSRRNASALVSIESWPPVQPLSLIPRAGTIARRPVTPPSAPHTSFSSPLRAESAISLLNGS